MEIDKGDDSIVKVIINNMESKGENRDDVIELNMIIY